MRFAIVATGEGAQARIADEANLREQLHELMCVCGTPWKECKTEGVLEAIETLDDENNWQNDDDGKPFSIQILQAEISDVMVYRLLAQPPLTGHKLQDALDNRTIRYSRDRGLPDPTPAFPYEVVFTMEQWERVQEALTGHWDSGSGRLSEHRVIKLMKRLKSEQQMRISVEEMRELLQLAALGATEGEKPLLKITFANGRRVWLNADGFLDVGWAEGFPRSEYPHPCGLCPNQIESEADLEWHGLGNCVPICERCNGSGQEPSTSQTK